MEVLGARRPLAAFQDNSEHLVNLKVLRPLHKSLFAVSELIKSCETVFDLDQYGENRKTGNKIQIYQRNGVFIVPVWFKAKPTAKMIAAQWDERAVADPFVGQPVKA